MGPPLCAARFWVKEKAGAYLFLRVVSNQLSSARQSLTTVFGMGTGGTSASSAPAVYAKPRSAWPNIFSFVKARCAFKTEQQVLLGNWSTFHSLCGQALDLLVHAG